MLIFYTFCVRAQNTSPDGLLTCKDVIQVVIYLEKLTPAEQSPVSQDEYLRAAFLVFNKANLPSTSANCSYCSWYIKYGGPQFPRTRKISCRKKHSVKKTLERFLFTVWQRSWHECYPGLNQRKTNQWSGQSTYNPCSVQMTQFQSLLSA